MRRNECASVGYDGTEVGYLERCEQYFSLTDGDTYDSDGTPIVTVVLCVEFGIGYHSS